MKTIMIDMDDTFCDGGFLYLINQFTGKSYTTDDVPGYYMQQLVKEGDRKAFFEYFLQNNLYDYSKMYPYAYEVIEELSNCYKIYIGTSYIYPECVEGDGRILNDKYNYLMKELPFLDPRSYVFLSDKSVLNCDIKIDDMVKNLKNAETKILFTAYHNRNISKEELDGLGIIRADSWLDVKRILLDEIKSD